MTTPIADSLRGALLEHETHARIDAGNLRGKVWRHLCRELGLSGRQRGETLVVTDRDLLPRLRAGDAEAFDHLFVVYGGRHLAFACRHLQRADAEDAVQVAWLEFARKAGQIPAMDSLGPYLQGFVRNAVLRTLQRIAKERAQREPMPEIPPDTEVADDSYITGMIRSEDRTRLTAALAELDLLLQEAVLLSIDGKSAAEIAVALDVEKGHARVLKHRALERLRQLLAGPRQEAPP